MVKFVNRHTSSQIAGVLAMTEDGEDTRNVSPKTTTRLRSACDSCHKSKIRCSSGNPCVTCQLSNSRCTYSPLNRLGRPKGSKNRRTLTLQQSNSKRENAQRRASNTERQNPRDANEQAGEDADMRQYMAYGSADSNLDFGFNGTLLEEPAVAEAAKDCNKVSFSPTLSSLIESLSETHMQPVSTAVSELEDVNGPMDLALSLFTQPSMPEFQSQSIDAFTCDSGYATSTGSTPWLSSSSLTFDNIHHRDTKPISDRNISPNEESGSTSSSRARAPSKTRCTCLQQQVQLVYQLSSLDGCCSQLGNSLSVQRVLRAVQSAQGPWNALMQCHSCQIRDNQNEVFLLFAMSIRILLTSVQKIAAKTGNEQNNETMSSAVSFKSLPPDTGLSLPVHVGGFELTGSAKDDVIRLALRQALQIIQSALLHLCERRVMSRPHQAADAQATGRQTSDADDWSCAPERHDYLPQFDADASLSPHSIEQSRHIRQPVSRPHDNNIRQPRTDMLSISETNSLFGDDDFNSMLETLHSSMSAVE